MLSLNAQIGPGRKSQRLLEETKLKEDKQWFSTVGYFAHQQIFGNVWRHFLLLQLGNLLAFCEER